MDEVYPRDFNMAVTENGETLVRVREINEMIRRGILTLDRKKMNEYHFDTRFAYNKESLTRNEAFNLYMCLIH